MCLCVCVEPFPAYAKLNIYLCFCQVHGEKKLKQFQLNLRGLFKKIIGLFCINLYSIVFYFLGFLFRKRLIELTFSKPVFTIFARNNKVLCKIYIGDI